jgi:hypothetical protein
MRAPPGDFLDLSIKVAWIDRETVPMKSSSYKIALTALACSLVPDQSRLLPVFQIVRLVTLSRPTNVGIILN